MFFLLIAIDLKGAQKSGGNKATGQCADHKQNDVVHDDFFLSDDRGFRGIAPDKLPFVPKGRCLLV